jgi:hypothetical protein
MELFIKEFGIPADQAADIIKRFWETYELACIQSKNSIDIARTVTTKYMFDGIAARLTGFGNSATSIHRIVKMVEVKYMNGRTTDIFIIYWRMIVDPKGEVSSYSTPSRRNYMDEINEACGM